MLLHLSSSIERATLVSLAYRRVALVARLIDPGGFQELLVGGGLSAGPAR